MAAETLLRRFLGEEFGGISLQEALDLCDRAGLCRSDIEGDLAILTTERLLMWLVDEDAARGLNYRERCDLIAFRLRQLVRDPSFVTPEVVREIARLQAVIGEARGERKQGINTLEEPIIEALLALQEHRCAICGAPLSARVRRKSGRFATGMEPLFEKQLDHALPFYLAANNRNRQLLCKPCNSLKSDLLGVQEDGPVFACNHIRPRQRDERRRRAMFWSLARDRRCSASACGVTARGSVLWARPRSMGTPWIYGQLVVECETHADPTAEYIHADVDPDAPTMVPSG